MSAVTRFVFALFIALTCSPVFASEHLALKIDIAGRQRMLTQRMVRSACFIAMEVDVKAHQKLLEDSAALFVSSLSELKTSGGFNHLEPATDPNILLQIGLIESLWDPFDQQISEQLNARRIGFEQLSRLSDAGERLLKASNDLVLLFEREANAVGAHLDPQQAKLVNLSGRQRMLLQRMGKQTCLASISSSGEENEAFLALQETSQMFHSTAFNLTFGAPDAGFPPSPNDHILEVNATIWQHWAVMDAILQGVGEKALTEKELQELSWDIEAMYVDLDAVVKLYADL
ncbi:type IV pili methyl-accepting chemotaxis transducer N-terminal domain-containing protein [Celeribacter litoreus]|uniref:type IV pili methyl-accepting chemotaxis transducer N-terminal domain-containing protein n=1 Tax=Celeribacter litoreus TaxID=2876714 RepID=UPI001CD018DD|nr:type IV pili methyl-accepting chemotaxis transducer N-terminal domain-containing protein [Celeribacter litoreus]MCA0042778.1 type IV pili methyl-accepting chemotaxis transducer N-terminal domain-containing protein [Celeribacter litoreus]